MLTDLYDQFAKPLKAAAIFKKIAWFSDLIPEQYDKIETPAAFIEIEENPPLTSPVGSKNYRFIFYVKIHIFVNFDRSRSDLSTSDSSLHDVQQKAADALYASELIGISPPKQDKNLLRAWLRYKCYGVVPLINRPPEHFGKPKKIRIEEYPSQNAPQ